MASCAINLRLTGDGRSSVRPKCKQSPDLAEIFELGLRLGQIPSYISPSLHLLQRRLRQRQSRAPRRWRRSRPRLSVYSPYLSFAIRRHRRKIHLTTQIQKQSTFLISIYDPPLVPPMTSAHRYPPPPPNSQNDFRLPSLKDLNFYRPSGAQPALPPSQQQEPGNLQPDQAPHPTRHTGNWNRSAYQPAQLATPAAHQQYTPASHEVSPKVEYSPKQENNGYAHPGVPLSVQATNSASMVPPRNEDASHSPSQPKRQRTAPSAASRDTRAPHVPFFLLSNKLHTDNSTCSLVCIPILNTHHTLRDHNHHLQVSIIQFRQACLIHLLMPPIRLRRPMTKYTIILILCR